MNTLLSTYDFNYLVSCALNTSSALSLIHVFHFQSNHIFPVQSRFYIDSLDQINRIPTRLIKSIKQPILYILNSALVQQFELSNAYLLFYEIRIVSISLEYLMSLQQNDIFERLVVIQYNTDGLTQFDVKHKCKRFESQHVDRKHLGWISKLFYSVVCYVNTGVSNCRRVYEMAIIIKQQQLQNVKLIPIIQTFWFEIGFQKHYSDFDCVIDIYQSDVSKLINNNIRIHGIVINTKYFKEHENIMQFLDYINGHFDIEFIDINIQKSKYFNKQLLTLFSTMGNRFRNIHFYDYLEFRIFFTKFWSIHELKRYCPHAKLKIGDFALKKCDKHFRNIYNDMRQYQFMVDFPFQSQTFDLSQCLKKNPFDFECRRFVPAY